VRFPDNTKDRPNDRELPLKCLLVADLHYDLRKFDWVVDAAAHVDVVVLAGDHLEIAAIVDRPAQTIVVQKYFKRLQAIAPLLICSGNHDLDARNASGELVAKWLRNARYMGIPTDGDAKQIGDTLFSLCPWWDGERGKAEIGEQLARDAKARPARWVWVYHRRPKARPPAGAASAPSAMRRSRHGSRNTSPISFSRAMSISRPSCRTAHGPTGSARPGCSMPAIRSGRSRRMSSSISTSRGRSGCR